MTSIHHEISIVLAGAAGKGVQTVESMLLDILKRDGYRAFASKEYMSRVRGGSNSTEIRVSSKMASAFVRGIDILFLLDKGAYAHMRERISSETLVFADEAHESIVDHTVIAVPISSIARELGNPLFSNVVAAGAILGMLNVGIGGTRQYLERRFASKGSDIVERNIEAADRGYKIGAHLAYVENFQVNIARDERVKTEVSLSGNDAISMGMIAGGCNFISSYPMSPSTGVLQFLAEQSNRFGIVVEQVEDEIAAINMALGASYAGARAVVTTAGGGFALMEEGVSLAGMIETPIVIHIAQRPGPATGLPTRTEQGDLNLALFSGHGEFPRAIFAPGTHEEAFAVTKYAFDMAEKWQSPVFLLSDQYLLDTVTTLPASQLTLSSQIREIVETKQDYERYRLTENGVSPRGVPGFGTGLVVADSDEHTADGHLTERLDTRVAMMKKRMKKLDGLVADVLPPTRIGIDAAEIVIVGWGSTYGAIVEAVQKIQKDSLSVLHFSQVFPLPAHLVDFFKDAKKIIVVENNFSGQFADLLEKHGVGVTDRILKYDGEPFGVDELQEKISTFLF